MDVKQNETSGFDSIRIGRKRRKWTPSIMFNLIELTNAVPREAICINNVRHHATYIQDMRKV